MEICPWKHSRMHCNHNLLSPCLEHYIYIFAWNFWRKPPIGYLNNLIWSTKTFKTYHLLLPLFSPNKVRNPNPRDQSRNLCIQKTTLEHEFHHHVPNHVHTSRSMLKEPKLLRLLQKIDGKLMKIQKFATFVKPQCTTVFFSKKFKPLNIN